MVKLCSVEGCDTKHYGHGYCSRHLSQVKKFGKVVKTIYDKNDTIDYGDTLGIVLTNKDMEQVGIAIIDKSDAESVLQHKWGLDGRGYVMSGNRSRHTKLHRFIMNPGDDELVDHADGNPLNNTRSNLRVCTSSDNARNRKTQSNNSLGARGVSKRSSGKYRARITVGGKTINLGDFDSVEEAVEVRQQAEIKYFGEFRYNRGDM